MGWFKKKPSWEEQYAQTIYDGLVASGGPGDMCNSAPSHERAPLGTDS